jgi:hypothetical protein
LPSSVSHCALERNRPSPTASRLDLVRIRRQELLGGLIHEYRLAQNRSSALVRADDAGRRALEIERHSAARCPAACASLLETRTEAPEGQRSPNLDFRHPHAILGTYRPSPAPGPDEKRPRTLRPDLHAALLALAELIDAPR